MEFYSEFYKWTASHDVYRNCSTIRQAVGLACDNNDVESVSYLITTYRNMLFLVDLNAEFTSACKNNYVDVVKVMIANSDDLILGDIISHKKCVIINNNLPLLQILQEKWPESSNELFETASRHNAIEIATYLRQYLSESFDASYLIKILVSLRFFDMAFWISSEFALEVNISADFLQKILFPFNKSIDIKDLYPILKYWRHLISEHDVNRLFYHTCLRSDMELALLLKYTFDNINVKINNHAIFTNTTYPIQQWLLTFYTKDDLPELIRCIYKNLGQDKTILKYIILEFDIEEIDIDEFLQESFDNLIEEVREKSNPNKNKSAAKC